MDVMAAAADTFARFLAVLTDALDDHDASAADLAARVHLSRFHLDRIVAVAAGEPPARLRRRLLLERAAFRLLAGGSTIIDVAVEAGYSSHAAFTRAFSRSYGASPDRWRRAPTAVQLDGPSGIHFQPPGSLRLPSRRKVSSMDLLLRMVEHHVWLVGQMLDRAGTLDDARLDAPIELSVDGVDCDPTLRSLLARLVGQLDQWNSAIGLRGYDFAVERGESVAHMQERLARAGPAYAAQVREVCEQDRFDDTFIDVVCDPPRVFTYGGMVAHVLTFAAHRRTLVSGALIGAGISDLGHDPMQWMAESV